jgi:hypothetical protein
MHRLIRQWHFGDVVPGMHVDHADRNPDNNRIDNLRLATPTESTRNRLLPPGLSGFRGVTKKGNQWEAKVQVGTFDTPERAHEAYKQAQAVLFGEFSCAD